jgi:divalent metal cation (Fe/Co/Zn/Cd) transporter
MSDFCREVPDYFGSENSAESRSRRYQFGHRKHQDTIAIGCIVILLLTAMKIDLSMVWTDIPFETNRSLIDVRSSLLTAITIRLSAIFTVMSLAPIQATA